MSAPHDNQTLFALDLRALPFWLATLDEPAVSAEHREALTAYKREAMRVLAAHFLDTIPGRRLLYAVVPAHLLRDARTP
jgi:hypothetical protein